MKLQAIFSGKNIKPFFWGKKLQISSANLFPLEQGIQMNRSYFSLTIAPDQAFFSAKIYYFSYFLVSAHNMFSLRNKKYIA